MLDTLSAQFLDKYSRFLDHSNITPDLYTKFNVKRGLRNQDGTGVLVGLTEIGDVHGYIKDEEEKIPVEGVLRYRGIDIQNIVKGFQARKEHGFEETAFLLLFGFLPTQEELVEFKRVLGELRTLPAGFTEDMILKNPSNNIMNKLARSVLAMYSYDDDPENYDITNVLFQSVRLIAQFPTIVSYAYQAKKHYYNGGSLFIHSPMPNLSTSENLLLLCRADKKYTKLEAEILDLCLVLHAEHGGGNNSAFTTHLVSSSQTDTYSAISAAIGSLKGELHGGANIRVHSMIQDFKKNIKDWKSEKEVGEYIEKILKKEAYDKKGLVYGMGHAVYTLSDPRAELLRGKAEELSKAAGRSDEFALYQMIEKLTPEIFKRVKGSDKDISANVDFYSGFVYDALNIPSDLFTPIFAISRIAGWTAHRVEELLNGRRIMRPAYKSVAARSEYTPIEKRGTK